MSSKSVHWRHLNIHSPRELRAKSRRLDRRNIDIEAVLSELRRGACLRLSFSPRRHWKLSSGLFVTNEIADAVVKLPCVVSCGDSLLADAPAQTWRFRGSED